MNWKEAKESLLIDEARKLAYEKLDLNHEIAKMVTDARIAKKMTQAHLANLMGTKQPSIARIEKGEYLPSLSFLNKIAQALNTQLLPPRFEFLTKEATLNSTIVTHSQYVDLKDYIRINPISSSTMACSATRANVRPLSAHQG